MTIPRTLGQLRQAGYRPLRVKDEMRANLLRRLALGGPVLPGMVGFEDTVGPEVANAVLARHDLLLLGLRGQGKTRLLRQLASLLDEAVPVVAGSELRDDPLAPISAYARRRIAAEGDSTPVEWLGREERYLEKLATPDVTMADLFGDLDLSRHLQGHALADEGSLHFGLVPRSNRGILCVNELPDLAPRIQVGLFNVLQERDVQLRGVPVRFALDAFFCFSANPEDYTSRGRIVTPLKDRIGSVVRTHYPRTRAEGVAVADGNAWEARGGVPSFVPGFLKDIVEETARRARSSPAVNAQSGVSARFSIAAREALLSAAEARAARLGERCAVPRPCDLAALLAAGRGKLELVLADEDGHEDRLLAQLASSALLAVFLERTSLEALREVLAWFAGGGRLRAGPALPAQPVPACLEAHAAALVLDAPAVCRAAALASAAEFLAEGLHRAGKLRRDEEAGGAAYG